MHELHIVSGSGSGSGWMHASLCCTTWQEHELATHRLDMQSSGSPQACAWSLPLSSWKTPGLSRFPGLRATSLQAQNAFFRSEQDLALVYDKVDGPQSKAYRCRLALPQSSKRWATIIARNFAIVGQRQMDAEKSPPRSPAPAHGRLLCREAVLHHMPVLL